MIVESIEITKLQFDPSNARKHSTKNLDAIKGSLAKFGQQKPIVVGKGNVVIAGNGTLEAARALGWEKINVVRTDLEGADATAFAIADNRTGELADWDNDVLRDTLYSLKSFDFDLNSMGFSELDLKSFEPPEMKELEGAKELDSEDFENFGHKCPRCGFEFDADSST